MCEKLFKNNIPFYRKKDEYTNKFNWEIDNTIVTIFHISYKTNTIYQPIKLGISNYKD